jgi:hypothetical protein
MHGQRSIEMDIPASPIALACRELNVVIVSYELLPQTGTSARTLGFVSLTSRKHRVVALAPRAQDRDEASLVRSYGVEYTGIDTAEFGPNPARSILYAAAFISALRKIHFASCSINALLYPFSRRLLHVPIVSDLHALGKARIIGTGLTRPLLQWTRDD